MPSLARLQASPQLLSPSSAPECYLQVASPSKAKREYAAAAPSRARSVEFTIEPLTPPCASGAPPAERRLPKCRFAPLRQSIPMPTTRRCVGGTATLSSPAQPPPTSHALRQAESRLRALSDEMESVGSSVSPGTSPAASSILRVASASERRREHTGARHQRPLPCPPGTGADPVDPVQRPRGRVHRRPVTRVRGRGLLRPGRRRRPVRRVAPAPGRARPFPRRDAVAAPLGPSPRLCPRGPQRLRGIRRPP